MSAPALKMEATSAVAALPSAPRRPSAQAPSSEDPFLLGVRECWVTAADGRQVLEQVPLTYEDLVYPQEGDMSQGSIHYALLSPWEDALRRFLKPRGLVVTSDVLLILHDRRTSAPDVAVMEGDVDPSKIHGAIDLEARSARLRFAFEVISTSAKGTEKKDTKANLKRYAAEGVEEYFSLYPLEDRKVKDLVGRRLTAAGYVEVAPDDEGRVYSEVLDLYFSIDPGNEELVAIDATTGERVLISDELAAAHKAEEAARKAAEQRADEEAEQRKAEEQQRKAAEQRADEEAEQRKAEAEQRKAAEQSLRTNVRDLCGILGIEWTAERNAHTEDLSATDLKALWTHLVEKKRWP